VAAPDQQNCSGEGEDPDNGSKGHACQKSGAVQVARRSVRIIVDQKVREGGCREENSSAAKDGQDSHGEILFAW